MKMVWHISLLLFNFFLKSFLLLSGKVTGTLSKTLLELWRLANVNQNLVAVFKETKSESTESNLNNSSVEKNLVGDLLLGDDLRKSGLHQQVLGFIKLVVDGQVVNLEKSCLDLHLTVTVCDHLGHEFCNNFLGWLLHEVQLFELLCLAFESLLGLGVDRVVLIVDSLELDEADLSNLLLVIMLFQMFQNLIAHFEEEAFISKSLEVFNRGLVKGLECFEKLLV